LRASDLMEVNGRGHMRPEPRAIRRGKSRRCAHASHAMLLWKSEQFGWDSEPSRPPVSMEPAAHSDNAGHLARRGLLKAEISI